MKNVTKFTFDTHFDAGNEQLAASARSRKSYSPEDIDVLCKQARDEGRKDGDIRAAQAVAASIGQVAAAVLDAINAMKGEVETIRTEAAGLALAAARKLAGAALASTPEAEITEALEAAMQQAVSEPRLVIKTAPRLAVAIEARAVKLAAEHGFEGRMQFLPDPKLRDSDCRIEWRGGGLELSHQAIDEALADLIARRFTTPALSEVKE